MTGRSVKEALLVGIGRIVLGAHRIVGAEPTQLQSPLQMSTDVLAHLHQAAEAALRLPAPPVSVLFDDVFAVLTPELRRQRREWLATRARADLDD